MHGVSIDESLMSSVSSLILILKDCWRDYQFVTARRPSRAVACLFALMLVLNMCLMLAAQCPPITGKLLVLASEKINPGVCMRRCSPVYSNGDARDVLRANRLLLRSVQWKVVMGVQPDGQGGNIDWRQPKNTSPMTAAATYYSCHVLNLLSNVDSTFIIVYYAKWQHK